MQIIPLPAFRDNYIWVLHDDHRAVVVDPGDAAPVLGFLAERGLALEAVLVTHHHPDHVDGIAGIVSRHPAPVYGPAAETIAGVTVRLREGDTVLLPGLRMQLGVLDVPGHTAGHIAYHGNGYLFCGDTLFSAGCGRLFEGTAAQMAASLDKLAALPDDTVVYCTHEYTLSNLAFAAAAEPVNIARDNYRKACEALRQQGLPTLPTSIGREKAINPFLRTRQPGVVAGVAAHTGTTPDTPLACFAALREWKNVF
ncbi:hydroxyacylglutathione hydrolase [Azoarcus olearius]|uniref:hydroxyacylglutathione hydrolase n=1 Tax=Azoarcus sp. (strain BH72) TaxID=418699 RepID=UPI000806D4A1|nr:hydroxyacylglutathione hydrolase [Azoarcus olearius]